MNAIWVGNTRAEAAQSFHMSALLLNLCLEVEHKQRGVGTPPAKDRLPLLSGFRCFQTIGLSFPDEVDDVVSGLPHRAGFSVFPRKCRWIKPPDVNDWGVDSTTPVVAWVLGEFPMQTQLRNGRGRKSVV